jgi:hypothetical protein
MVARSAPLRAMTYQAAGVGTAAAALAAKCSVSLRELSKLTTPRRTDILN